MADTTDTVNVTIALSQEEYERLAAMGVALERNPDQQARWLVREALRNDEIGEAVANAFKRKAQSDEERRKPRTDPSRLN